MKKTILAVCLLCGFALNTWAQDTKHELTVGYGIGTTSEFVDAFANVIVSGLTYGSYTSNGSYTGTFNVGYKYGFTDRLWAGATFLYESGKSDAYADNVKFGKFNNNFYTLALEARYNYLNKRKFALYGLLGAGATLYNQQFTSDKGEKDSDNVVHFNFQLTPIGIRYGGTFGAFAEAGFGYKGIVSVGVFDRF